jgi:TPR repeat protein
VKICPQCDTGYPDNTVTCPTHGEPLSKILDLRPGMLILKTYRIERLGFAYRNGAGVTENKEKARQLLQKACSLGNPSSCDSLNQL